MLQRCISSICCGARTNGGLAERLKAPVLKTGGRVKSGAQGFESLTLLQEDFSMADYYTQFSVLLDVNKHAGEWLIDEIYNYSAEDDGESDFICNAEWVDDKVWLYADEYFNADMLADKIQHMLRKFKLDKVFRFSWAETCNKLRADCFGGGWCAVSRDEILIGTTWGDMCEAEEALKTGNFRC